MKNFSRLFLTAASIHVVSAAGYLRGVLDISLSSRPENVPQAEYGVTTFDLLEVSFFPSILTVHHTFCDDGRCRCVCLIDVTEISKYVWWASIWRNYLCYLVSSLHA
jgi:hypothetical protein